MKVVYDNAIFKLQKYGGISRYFLEIMSRLKQNSRIQISMQKIFKGKIGRLNHLIIDYCLSREKFDIYHPTYYSFAIKKRPHVKTVITVFDMIHELFPGEMAKFTKDIYIKKSSIANADFFICISYTTKNDLQRIYGIEDKKISVIYLGVPVNNIEPADEKYNISDRPYFLFVGKRQTYKNFNVLLHAFESSKLSREFDLICFGGENFSREEASELKKMNLLDSVKHLEGSDELLHSCYRNAVALVYPSLYEGFGLPVLEAFSLKCPVIASNTPALAEVAESAALLFSPLNVSELAEKIEIIVNNEKMRNELIEKGKRRSQDFSWEKTALETFDVYRRLLN